MEPINDSGHTRICTHWHHAAGLRRSTISSVANLEFDTETGRLPKVKVSKHRMISIHLSASKQNYLNNG